MRNDSGLVPFVCVKVVLKVGSGKWESLTWEWSNLGNFNMEHVKGGKG